MIPQTTRDELFDLIGSLTSDRLSAQLRFVVEIDRLKTILRRTPIIDLSRRENDAEHSWHLAMMAMLLREFASPGVDVDKALRMLLVHDIVEIDAGDTFLYDETGQEDQDEREQRAADRLFGMLPAEQGTDLRALWDEFEAHESETARFARTMDRLQPFLHNIFTGGAMWREHGVNAAQVRKRMAVIADGSSQLHQLVLGLLDEAVRREFLPAGPAA
ncbi:hydrolase [Devosia pacifica]|uniref:Hydrolase n=1 Tax=Devosia pacifica TaxID=1335967 RepID=A0A918SBJ4_9HYPH|nr:HD domain-containing protein [Devosia pacifica]GHA30865.1 hydrolase [Devosia pacifica]